MLSLAGIAAGIAMLIGGGTLLVRGASEIATRHNISPIVVGLVIIGFGTSSPELVINILGALSGQTELAFGNAVGSNIANLGLILGISALLMPMVIESSIVRRELPLLLLAMVTSLAIFRNGTTPWLSTLVELIWAPVARMLDQSLPSPPDHLESWAFWPSDLKMWSRSSLIVVR